MNAAQQKRYRQMLRRGESPRLAEMLACQQAPKANTDVEFFQGHGTLAKQFEGDELNLGKLVKAAKAKGYTPNPNDIYMRGLANDFGDPLAFVPATGGRGHVKKVCESRNWGCDGAVKVKQRDITPTPDVPLAPDLVEQGVKQIIAAEPDIVRKADKKELRAEAVKRFGKQR